MSRQALSPFRRERILRQGTEAVFEETDLPRLLGKVVERACALLGADDGAIGLVEGTPPVVRIASVFRMPDSEVGTVWGPGQGLAGRVLESQAAVLVDRYEELAPDCAPALRENAVVGLPIMRRRHMVGYFGIGATAPHKFSTEDVRLLRQFARACGAAIENAQLLASTKGHLDDTRLQYELSVRISTGSETRDVVRAYLMHIARTLGFVCTVVVNEFDSDGVKTHNVVIGQWSPARGLSLTPRRTPHIEDALDPILDGGDPVWIPDALSDPRASKGLRDEQRRDGRPAVALVPLVSRGRRIGLVVLSHAVPVEWNVTLVRPIVMTGNYLASALDSRTEHATLESARDAARISHERQRIARDLHDSVTQMLFAVHVTGQTLGQGAAGKADPDGFRRLLNLTTSTLREMRGLLQELHPAEDGPSPRVRGFAIDERLRRHAGEIGARFTLQFDLRTQGPSNPEIAHALFRIGQEALTNSHRHASASTVRVMLSRENGAWTLAISDDGKGLGRRKSRPEGPSFGLTGMAERAAEFGGKLTVGKNSPRGTLVTCRIPENVPQ